MTVAPSARELPGVSPGRAQPAAGRRRRRRGGHGPARRRPRSTSARGRCARASSCAAWSALDSDRWQRRGPVRRLTARPCDVRSGAAVVTLGACPAAVQVPGARVAAVDRVGLPRELRRRVRRSPPGSATTASRSWSGPTRSRQEAGGAALRCPSTARRTGRVRPRADAAADPAGLGPRPVDQAGPRRCELADDGRRRHGRRAPAVPLAARLRPRTSSRAWRCASTRPASRSRSRTCSRGGPRNREMLAYLPALGPGRPAPTTHVTLDLSHTATAGLGRDGDGATRSATGCAHVHLADGTRLEPRTSTWCPGAARSRAPRCSRCWRGSGFDGHVVVEVGTRRRGRPAEREADLAEALAFARLHLRGTGDEPATGGRERPIEPARADGPAGSDTRQPIVDAARDRVRRPGLRRERRCARIARRRRGRPGPGAPLLRRQGRSCSRGAALPFDPAALIARGRSPAPRDRGGRALVRDLPVGVGRARGPGAVPGADARRPSRHERGGRGCCASSSPGRCSAGSRPRAGDVADRELRGALAAARRWSGWRCCATSSASSRWSPLTRRAGRPVAPELQRYLAPGPADSFPPLTLVAGAAPGAYISSHDE